MTIAQCGGLPDHAFGHTAASRQHDSFRAAFAAVIRAAAIDTAFSDCHSGQVESTCLPLVARAGSGMSAMCTLMHIE